MKLECLTPPIAAYGTQLVEAVHMLEQAPPKVERQLDHVLLVDSALVVVAILETIGYSVAHQTVA